MNHRRRVYKLRNDADRYHLMDPRWRRNFRARVNCLAKQYDPKHKNVDMSVVMTIDHIALVTDMSPTFKVGK